MKSHLIGVAAAALLTTAAHAQNASSAHNPAIKDSDAAHVAASADGANSFTERQAQGRLDKAGYTNVSALVKDKDGVWRGTAMHGGKTVKVGLDFKGNITTR